MTRVLIFESDHAFAVELRTELSALGCTVQVFKEGATGLMAAAQSTPDLVLVSAELPRMNGFLVCNKLKKEPALQAVPVILMSTDQAPETFEQHRKTHTRADDYVRKPISFADLLARIQTLVPIGARHPDATSEIVIEDGVISLDSEVHEPSPDSQLELVTMDVDPSEMMPREEDMPMAPPPAGPALVGVLPPIPPGGSPPSDFGMVDIDIDAAMSGIVSSAPSDPWSATTSSGDPWSQAAAPEPQFMQYALGEEDDEEATNIEPPHMIAQRMTLPSQVDPSALAGHAHPSTHARSSPASQSVTQLKTNVAVPQTPAPPQSKPAPPSQPRMAQPPPSQPPAHQPQSMRAAEAATSDAALQASLTQARHALSQAQQELAQLRPQASELARAKTELADLRRQLAVGREQANAAASRESFELREALQQRDRELLSSREQLTARDRELIVEREQSLIHQQEIAQLRQTVVELQSQASESLARIHALQAEKALADKRAADFRDGARKISEQLNHRATELRDARSKYDEEREKLTAQHQQTLRETEERYRQEIGAIDAQREAARTKLEGDHAAALERMRSEHAAAVVALEAERDATVAARVAVEQEHAALEARLQELERGYAEARRQIDALTAERDEARKSRDSVEAARAELEQWMTDTAAAHEKRVEELTSAHARQISELERENAEALQAAGYEFQTKLLEKEASFKEIKSRLDADLQEVLEEKAELAKTATERGARLEQLEREVAEHEQLRERLEADAGEMRERQEAEIEQIMERFEADTNELRNKHQTELERVVSDLARTNAALEKARRRWGEDREALQRARDALSSIISVSMDDESGQHGS